MRTLANFILKGPSQAAAVTTLFGLLSLLLFPLGLLSSAVPGLVTLRHGAWHGLRVAGLAGGATAILAMLLFHQPLLAVGFLALLWIPIGGLAFLLRLTRSLDLTLALSLGFGLVILLVQYLPTRDPVALWQGILTPLAQELVTNGVLHQQEAIRVVQTSAAWLPGALAAGYVLHLTLSLLLARWWQAMAVNPGGFRQEFLRLRMPRRLSWFGAAITLMTVLGLAGDLAWLRFLTMLLAIPFLLQGLAVTHALLSRSKAAGLWLGLLYLALLLLMPYTVMTLVTLGYIDGLRDLRRRFGVWPQDPEAPRPPESTDS